MCQSIWATFCRYWHRLASLHFQSISQFRVQIIFKTRGVCLIFAHIFAWANISRLLKIYKGIACPEFVKVSSVCLSVCVWVRVCVRAISARQRNNSCIFIDTKTFLFVSHDEYINNNNNYYTLIIHNNIFIMERINSLCLSPCH